jgi:hypothetical protein
MKATKTPKSRSKGVLVQADDLEIGSYYTVHSLKHDRSAHLPIAGQSFKITALNLPFLVGWMVPDPSHPSVTFDVRFLNFMRVSPEYVQAQKTEPKNVP